MTEQEDVVLRRDAEELNDNELQLEEELIGTIKHGDELNLIIFIEQYYEIIISHNNQYNKWEGTFCLNLWHWHILKLRNNITLFHEPILNPSGNCDCITVITATNINITYK